MKLLQTRPLLAALAIFTASALPTSLKAQAIYTANHGDIGVGYLEGDQEFEPHWHLGAGAVVDGSALLTEEEYEPGDLVARTSSTRNSPTGLSDSIGVPDGTSIFTLGSSTYQPNLGFAVEELDENDWDGNITLTLSDWTLPSASAEFAVFTTNFGGVVVDKVFSTYSPGSTVFANSLPMTPGDHLHFDFGFTEAGSYDLEFTWTGTHVTDGLISTTSSFTIEAVPEPSVAVMVLLGLGGGLALRRRWSRA